MLWVTAVNVSGLDPLSDYIVQIGVNNTVIADGYVRQHRREEGWRELLRMIADGKEVTDND